MYISFLIVLVIYEALFLICFGFDWKTLPLLFFFVFCSTVFVFKIKRLEEANKKLKKELEDYELQMTIAMRHRD